MKAQTVDNKELQLSGKGFNTNTNWVDAEFTIVTAADFGFKIAKDVVVGYNVQRNELYIRDGKDVQQMSMSPANNKIRLQVLLDKSSVEIFVNDGEKVLTTLIFPDKAATGLAVFAENGAVQLDGLKAWDLGK